jgi:predicted tellurium resistance membrane protein TerC
MIFVDYIAPLLSLILIEIILGIDNIIFISLLSQKLPDAKRNKFRLLGISLAMISRLGLLTLVSWLIHLEISLFTVFKIQISAKDLILIGGGLFLLYKGTKEIYSKTETGEEEKRKTKKSTFARLLVEVLILDIVFSLDSIITAVGMVDKIWIMYIAVVISVGVMLFASKPISNFILKHPSFKILALCFLILIGVSLIAEALDFHIPKGYIYFAMAFSFLVDLIQLKLTQRKEKRTGVHVLRKGNIVGPETRAGQPT